MKKINFNDVFVSVVTGDKIRVSEVSTHFGEETKVKYESLDRQMNGEITLDKFKKCFKSEKFKDSVNQDIIKLIEAGYEFKSFFGDTLDGRSISLDLNEEDE